MERDSGYTARCRPPRGTQFPRAAVGGAPTRPGPARLEGWSRGARRRRRGGWLGWAGLSSVRLGRAGLGWVGSSFLHRSPGRAGSDGAEPRPAHCCLRGGGGSCQPAPSPPVPVAPAVSTGTTSAAEPPRLPPAPAFVARHGQARGGGRRERTSPLQQPGREVGARARGRWGRGGPRGSRPGSAGSGRARPDAPGCRVASCGIFARFRAAGLPPEQHAGAAAERRAARFAPACASEWSVQRWENCSVLGADYFTEGTGKRWNHLS